MHLTFKMCIILTGQFDESYPEEGFISWSFLNNDVSFPGNSAWRARREI